MKSLSRLGTRPASLPVLADDVIEFHAARLLLLLSVCGTSGRIDGLTKMAKLDFFVRYPAFFAVAQEATTQSDTGTQNARSPSDEPIESAMVRHHYGPWDKRYYHVLGHLEARGLITVVKQANSYRIALTDLGKDRAKVIASRSSFEPIVSRMRDVKKTFGAKSGAFLKNLIYRVFDAEVGRRPLGEVIHQ